MKKGKTFLGFVLAGLWFFGLMPCAQAAPTVRLDLSEDVPDPFVCIGDTFQVTVYIEDVTAEIALLAFGFDLDWSTNLGNQTDFSLQEIVGQGFRNTSDSFFETDVAGLAFPAAVCGDDIPLATLSFIARDAGDSFVEISSAFEDLNEGLFFMHNKWLDMSARIDFTVLVPIPPTMLLLSSGLAALAFIRRKSCE